MDKKKIGLLVIGIVATVVALVGNFVFYKSLNNLTIVATKDSYAYSYAKGNMIGAVVASDSDLDKLTTKLEKFDYNINNNEIEITGYKGISSKVVIPKYIGNKKVTSLNAKLPSETKAIVISNNITKANEDYLKDIEVYCYEDSALKENENLNIKLLNDSDIVYFDNSSEMFSYDINNNKATINTYLGDDNVVVIPETINGYEVERLDFNGSRIKTIYIPNSVKSISSSLTSSIINKFFVTSAILIVVTCILYCVGISIKKVNDLTDIVYSMPRVITSIVYLIGNNAIIFLLRKHPFEYYKYLIISIIVSAIYLALAFILTNVHKNNKKFDKEQKQKGAFIKEALELTDNESLIELLKYSDPVSTEEVKEIEENIIDELKTSKDTQKIEKLIEKRNRIIKNNK